MKKKIIFDLGGVLFELDFKNAISKLLNSKEANFELLFKKWLFSESVRLFESGKTDFNTFYNNLSNEFSLDLDFETFTKYFKEILLDPFPDVDETLKRLAENYDIYLLSNITKIHWDIISSYEFIKKYTKKPFLSYQMGVAKPEDEVYKMVINELGVSPNEILYFDDSKSNVNAGLKNGLNSHQTIGFKEVKAFLLSNKLL